MATGIRLPEPQRLIDRAQLVEVSARRRRPLARSRAGLSEQPRASPAMCRATAGAWSSWRNLLGDRVDLVQASRPAARLTIDGELQHRITRPAP